MYTTDDVQAHEWVVTKVIRLLKLKEEFTSSEYHKLIGYINNHAFYLSDGSPYLGRVIYRIEDMGRGVTEMWGRVEMDVYDVYKAYTPKGVVLYNKDLEEWEEPL